MNIGIIYSIYFLYDLSIRSAILHLPGAIQSITLYDVNTALAAGEAMDLEDEAYFTGIGIVLLKNICFR